MRSVHQPPKTWPALVTLVGKVPTALPTVTLLCCKAGVPPFASKVTVADRALDNCVTVIVCDNPATETVTKACLVAPVLLAVAVIVLIVPVPDTVSHDVLLDIDEILLIAWFEVMVKFDEPPLDRGFHKVKSTDRVGFDDCVTAIVWVNPATETNTVPLRVNPVLFLAAVILGCAVPIPLIDNQETSLHIETLDNG